MILLGKRLGKAAVALMPPYKITAVLLKSYCGEWKTKVRGSW